MAKACFPGTVLAARCDGRTVVTLEGVQEQAAAFGAFLADEGAEQYGFCSPGFIMDVLVMERELHEPTEDEIKRIWRGICAAAAAIRAGCRPSKNIWQQRGSGYELYQHRRSKKDAMSLVTEKGVYTGDTVPAGALRLKLLRSPHVHAFIRSIDVSRAKQVPGVVCVLTYEDAPGSRFTTAGQNYPEPSPYDRLILDRLLRCTGDPVAIVAAETEEAARAGLPPDSGGL